MKKYRYYIDYCTYPSYLLAKKGYSICDIAEIRDVSEGTIVNHLIPYIYEGCFSSIDGLVSDEVYNKVSDYLMRHQYCDELKPIYESLNGEVSYNDIHICYYYWHKTRRRVFNDDKVKEDIINARNCKKYYTEIRIINEKLCKLKSDGRFLGFIGEWGRYRGQASKSPFEDDSYKEDTWYAMTDGMYGDYPGGDVDYDFLGY